MRTAIFLALLAGCGGRIAPSRAQPAHCTVIRDNLDMALLIETKEVSCDGTTVVSTQDMLSTR